MPNANSRWVSHSAITTNSVASTTPTPAQTAQPTSTPAWSRARPLLLDLVDKAPTACVPWRGGSRQHFTESSSPPRRSEPVSCALEAIIAAHRRLARIRGPSQPPRRFPQTSKDCPSRSLRWPSRPPWFLPSALSPARRAGPGCLQRFLRLASRRAIRSRSGRPVAFNSSSASATTPSGLHQFSLVICSASVTVSRSVYPYETPFYCKLPHINSYLPAQSGSIDRVNHVFYKENTLVLKCSSLAMALSTALSMPLDDRWSSRPGKPELIESPPFVP